MALILRTVSVIIATGAWLMLCQCSLQTKPTVIKQDGPPQDGAQLNLAATPDAIPHIEPKSRYGNPNNYTIFGKTYHVLSSAEHYHAKGLASWYGSKFHGRLTSTREPYDMLAMTAAHKELPIPCYVRVHNLTNHKTAIVRVNDRGPFHADRIIDLSYAAAIKLGIAQQGTALVEVDSILPNDARQHALAKQISQNKHSNAYLQFGLFSDINRAHICSQKLNQHAALVTQVNPIQTGHSMLYAVVSPSIMPESQAREIIETLKKLGITAQLKWSANSVTSNMNLSSPAKFNSTGSKLQTKIDPIKPSASTNSTKA